MVAPYTAPDRQHFAKVNTDFIFIMGLENLRKEEELKSPERRKAKKPLIEKQRRRRINESLNELKVLVLQALNKDDFTRRRTQPVKHLNNLIAARKRNSKLQTKTWNYRCLDDWDRLKLEALFYKYPTTASDLFHRKQIAEMEHQFIQGIDSRPSLYSKMEKADILDLTVNYLKSVKCEQGYLRDATSLAKYRAGYNDCAGEMTRYLMSDTGLDYHSKAKLLSQVASFCQNANLRTTADMNARAPQAPLFVRPVLTPIGSSTTTCPTIPSSIPICPANYNRNENKRPTFPLPSGSTGPGDQVNPSYCRYLMSSSSMNSLGGLGTSTSTVWRPW